jgi:hypothetical protein
MIGAGVACGMLWGTRCGKIGRLNVLEVELMVGLIQGMRVEDATGDAITDNVHQMFAFAGCTTIFLRACIH